MKTLKIQFPIGRTFIQAILLLVVFLSILEMSSRTLIAKETVGQYEFFGSAHPHFDAQIINIRERAIKEERIDCIFIGNSQVLFGIDPAIVEKTYFEKTGKEIVCQNFGLGGTGPFSALPIINILINKYHPSIVILGTSIFDYATTEAIGGDLSILLTPWIKYQLGEFTIDGWLIENSNSYRYYLGIDHYLLSTNSSRTDFHVDGYSYRGELATMSIENQKEYFDDILPRPKITVEAVSVLREILKLQSDNIDILIVEVPFSSTIFEIRPKARNVYPEFISTLTQETEKVETRVWFSQNDLEIPENGWFDIYHLNGVGTQYFSGKIGEWLSEIDLYLH